MPFDLPSSLASLLCLVRLGRGQVPSRPLRASADATQTGDSVPGRRAGHEEWGDLHTERGSPRRNPRLEEPRGLR